MLGSSLSRKLGISLFIFLIASMFAQNWNYELAIVSGDATDSTYLTIGVHEEASTLFDEEYDMAFPIAPPVGMYSYFPIDDPFAPGITMLGADIRGTEFDEIQWEIRVERDLSGGSTRIIWNPDDLPFYPGATLEWASAMEITAIYPGTSITEWENMATLSYYEFLPGQIVYIRVSLETRDNLPPQVTDQYPDDGDTDISILQPLEIDLQDPETNVNPSTIVLNVDGSDVEDFHLTPITNGYTIEYLPLAGWDVAEEVCVEVTARDIQFPSATLEDYSYCFTTEAEFSDTLPPFYENVSVSDEEIDVSIYETIYIEIYDIGEGVDVVSIMVEINGENYTDILINSIHGFSNAYSIQIFPPEEGWDECEVHDVDIIACDMAEPSNCSNLSFEFTAECLPSEDWTLSLNAWTAIPTDTINTSLNYGITDMASDDYDPALDIPNPRPDFATFAYFPVEDEDYPLVTKLQDDMRGRSGLIQWEVMYNNPLDNNGITWDRAEVSAIEDEYYVDFKIGFREEGGPTTWFDMEHRSEITFPSESYGVIRYERMVRDTVPPYVENITPNPDSILLGAPPTVFSFDLRDENGIDESTIELYVNDIEIGSSEISMEMLEDGFTIHYTPRVVLEYGIYEFRVEACDNMMIPNCSSTTWDYEYKTCIPEFDLEMVCTDQNIAGDTLRIATIEIGTRIDALLMRDMYDTPTFSPPAGTFFHFAIDDPYYDYLTGDYRPTCDSMQTWLVQVTRISGGDLTIHWDRDDIFDDETWMLGIAKSNYGMGVPADSEFVNMRGMESFSYTSAYQTYLKIVPKQDLRYSINGSVEFCDIEEDATCTINILDTEITTTTTGGTNDFTISDVPEGTYTLVASSAGYANDTINDVTVYGEDTEIDPFEFCNYSSISGNISIDGIAVSGIDVTIDEMIATTNSSGFYEIEGLIPGEYDVCMSGFGACYEDTCITMTIRGSAIYDFNYIPMPFTINGIVLVNDEPVSGAEISHCSSSEILAVTDSLGYFEIDSNYCGTHCLRASYITAESVDTTFWARTDVEVVFNLIGDDYHTLYGDVTISCGTSGTGAIVLLNDTDTIVVEGTEYSFEDLETGEYTLSVTYPYATSADTTVTLVTDTEINFELLCLLPVPELTVTGTEVSRPFIPGSLYNLVEWIAPSHDSELSIVGYHVYRDTESFIYPEDAEEIALLSDLTEYYDTDIEGGVEYFYGIVIEYDIAPYFSPVVHCESAVSEVHADGNEILIVDYDDGCLPIGSMGAEEALWGILESDDLGWRGGFTVTSQNPVSFGGYNLFDYSIIFVELGVHDASNPVMSEDMINSLIEYTENGGRIIVEGPDFGRLYRGEGGIHRDFFNQFGIGWTPEHDGHDESIGNVQSITGTGYFGSSVESDYAYRTLADRSVDDFTVILADPILTSQDELIRATVYAPSGSQERFASTIYLAGLEDEDMQVKIMRFYLDIDAIEEDISKPEEVSLINIAPNPFNSTTNISYIVDESSEITIEIYDIHGNLISTPICSFHTMGTYDYSYRADGIESGVYFVRLKSDSKNHTEKIIYIK